MDRRKYFLLRSFAVLMITAMLCGCSAKSEPEAPTPSESPVAQAVAATPKPAAAGIVRGKVTDSNSNMLIAGIVITDEDGTTVRETTNDYGGYELKLDPGEYTLSFSKGPEFDTVTRTVEVGSLKTIYLPDVRLTQLSDSYGKGWIAGDAHQHTYYSDGVDSVQELINTNASMGLYWGFLTDHNTSRGVPEWTSNVTVSVMTDAYGSIRSFCGLDGVEVTTEFGHYNSLGSGLTLETYDLNLREAERSSKDKAMYVREKIAYIADSIKRVGGIAQINHPYSSTTMGAANWIDSDDFGIWDAFETIEIWNGYFVPPDGIYKEANSMNQNYSSKLLWYRLLNAMKEGHPYHAATGGTDNHDSASRQKNPGNAASVTDIASYYDYIKTCGKYPGMPTTYIHVPEGKLCMETVQQALRNGNSFLSSGPVVICDIDGVSYGEVLVPDNNELTIRTDIFNRDGLKEVRVVVNGEVEQTVQLDGETRTYTAPINISGNWSTGDWILLEVLGPVGQYAVTNPIIIG